MSTIPVLAKVDVVVVGGTSVSVAIATAAAHAGASVFLAAPESYLGEDICATGRLWQKPEASARRGSQLLSDLFPKNASYVRPMDVKRTLDDALLEAGVDFRFLSCPSDLIVDGKGKVAGAIFTTKSGPYAIEAKRVIDGTTTARLARALGLPFTEWEGGSVEFRTTLLGGPKPSGEGLRVVERGQVQATPDEGDKASVPAYEVAMDIELSDWDMASVAAAEHTLRTAVWNPELTWISDRAFAVPGTRLEGCTGWNTEIAGFLVVGPCAAVDAKTAASLVDAGTAVRIGEQVGAEIGAAAHKARAASGPLTPMFAQAPEMEARLREPCLDPRALREAVDLVQGSVDASDLPVLAEVDVLVVGGGTGGGPAAIAAARAGAKTLCVEALHGLGGVATLGQIALYYYGYREGFTRECIEAMSRMVPGRNNNEAYSNPEWKSEWYRSEILRAGGSVWFGVTVSGAVVDGNRVQGAIVNTPWGRGIVLAKMSIDATGNCDLAAFAGAETREPSDADFVFQGSGMPSKPFRPAYRNTDYTFILDSDIGDQTRIFTVGRHKFTQAFDMGQISDTRERRQIIGDVTMTPVDVYLERTWPDTVCRCHSNFDTHGMTVFPMFHVLPPDHRAMDAWLPMRALTPKGLDGIAVTGLAVSAQRDVMPVLRMQPEVQNQAYALGLAAAWDVVAGHHDFRKTDFSRLQHVLVDYKQQLPEKALLTCDDPAPISEALLAQILDGPLSTHTEVATAYANPEATIAALSENVHEPELPEDVRGRRARMLAVLGSKAGEKALLAEVRQAERWDAGWNYRGMGQFGRSLSPLDDAIVCLGRIGSTKAAPEVLRLAATITSETELSHLRAVALYAEGIASNKKLQPEFVKMLAGILQAIGPLHDWPALEDELADIPASATDTSTRNVSLKELYIARALYRLGDTPKKDAQQALTSYAFDIRGQFASAAANVLR